MVNDAFPPARVKALSIKVVKNPETYTRALLDTHPIMQPQMQKTAQQGARANDHGRHAACYRTSYRNETPDSKSSCRTRRADHGRASSLTLGLPNHTTRGPSI